MDQPVHFDCILHRQFLDQRLNKATYDHGRRLILANAYGMEGVCLRLFNVYGPGQALSNPYTGVLAIFASRLLNGQRPLAGALGRNDVEPEIVGKSRIGDIRHCFCDTSKAAETLGFRATKDFQEGLTELAEWVAEQTADDRTQQARAELEARGLVA